MRRFEPQTDTRTDGSSWQLWLAGALTITAAGYLLLTAVTVGIGWLLTHALKGSVGAWDQHVARFFGRHRFGMLNDVTKRATSGVGQLVHLRHASLPALIIAAVVVAYLARRGRWREGAFLAIAFALEFLVYRSVVHLVPRQRPHVFDLDPTRSNTSFPSGHTGVFTVIFVGIALVVWWSTRNRTARVLSALAAIGGVGLVGFARVYRGDHGLIDVLVGVLLGLACLMVAAVAVRAPNLRRSGRSRTRVAPAVPTESDGPFDDQLRTGVPLSRTGN